MRGQREWWELTMQEKNNSKIGPFRRFSYFSNLQREKGKGGMAKNWVIGASLFSRT